MAFPAATKPAPASHPLPPRNFLGNQSVYCVISQRAGGISIGVNMNPDKLCNFDCVYCEVDRRQCPGPGWVDPEVMTAELDQLLGRVRDRRMGELGYGAVDAGLLPFKEVALSGDGEPTLCPNFRQVVEAVVHLRARPGTAFFKIVLLTNASGLHLPDVQAGVALLTESDEVWAKLDAGTQAYMNRINGPGASLDLVLANIARLAARRPVIIQSLFPLIHGEEPPGQEIHEVALRLQELNAAGARIPLVQVYSAHRPAADRIAGHLPLHSLSVIARTIRAVSGLPAEVF